MKNRIIIVKNQTDFISKELPGFISKVKALLFDKVPEYI